MVKKELLDKMSIYIPQSKQAHHVAVDELDVIVAKLQEAADRRR